MSDDIKKVFGIDLGTTYSCIAYVDEFEKPVVVANSENERITPSAVFYDNDNVVVGTEAKRNSLLSPEAVAVMVKRFMGNPNWVFESNGKSYRPEEVSSFILRKVVGDAEQQLNEKIHDVVITCPAYFGINEREATANAGKIAGLNVREIINEPTAAAIAYGMHQAEDQVVLVYDLGGGTFDVTMIQVSGESITVLCTGGDHNLGGREWDATLVNYLVQCFQQDTGSSEDILDDPVTCQDLFLTAETVKKTLSTRDKAPLFITHSGQRVKVELTREKFDELTGGSLARTIELTRKMLEEAAAKGHAHYDKILLVGGSSKMPQVQARLKKEFSVPCEIFDPDESVAKGAAIYGRMLAVQEKVIQIVEAQTGKKVADVLEVPTEDLGKAEEEVAGKLGLPPGKVKKMMETCVTNVTSKTFGIEVLVNREPEEYKMSSLIRRNDKVPADVTQTYYTVEANQPSVLVVCYETQDVQPLVPLEGCTEIGRFDMDLPGGQPEETPLDVTFRLSRDGRLNAAICLPGTEYQETEEFKTEAVMSKEEVAKATTRALAMQVS